MFGNMLMGAAGASLAAGGGYSVDNSIVLDDGSSQYLSGPALSSGSERIGTYSFWTKRGNLGTQQEIYTQYRTSSSNMAFRVRFLSGDTLDIVCENDAGSVILRRTTTQVFRDPHAFLHVHIQVNGNQTDDTCCTLTINGSAVSDFSTKTNLSSGTDLNLFTSSKSAFIGSTPGPAGYYDGYFSEFVAIDGGNAAATSFGEYDTNGVWRPIDVTDVATDRDQIPALTSNSAPSPYAVTASSEDGVGSEGYRMFANGSSSWRTASGAGGVANIVIDVGSANAFAATSLVLTGTSDAANRCPTNFTFEGSNTGSFSGEETVLYTGSSLSWSAFETKTFTFSNTTSFRYYKLDVTSTSGGTYVEIEEGEIRKEVTGDFGTNGFYLPFTDSTFLGVDGNGTGTAVVSYQSSQWTGNTGSYSYSNGRIDATTVDDAIKSVDTFTGDFELEFYITDKGNVVVGMYEISEDGTFDQNLSTGGLNNMTNSWWIKTSSVAANNDVMYGSTEVAGTVGWADGDTVKITRSSGTFTVYRNGSSLHEWSQTSSNEVRIVVGQGDVNVTLDQFCWVDAGTLGNNFFTSGSPTQSSDTPTNVIATLSPLWTDATLSNGNLTTTNSGAAAYEWSISTVRINDGVGKYVMEATRTAGTYGYVGVCEMGLQSAKTGNTNLYGINVGNGEIVDNIDGSGLLATVTTPGASVIRIEVDSSTSTIEIFDDGASVHSGTYTATNPVCFVVAPYQSSAFDVVFDTDSMAGTPSTGFVTLSTTNIYTNAAPAIEDGTAYFQTTLYTGNGASSHEINQSGENSTFAPDFLWTKGRTTTEHRITDILRGATKVFFTDSSLGNSASTTETTSVLSLDSDGFTVGSGGGVNSSGDAKLGWQWKAGDSNTVVSSSGSGDGYINACTHRANQTAGFSLVKYTGANSQISNGQDTKVTHGLGAKPELALIKNMDDTLDWRVLSTSTTGFAADSQTGDDSHLVLNSNAIINGSLYTGHFETGSDSTHFEVGNDNGVNKNGDEFMAFLFRSIPGYCKVTSYKGNGNSDGIFLELGFKASWIMFKRYTGSVASWAIYDKARDPFNAAENMMLVESTAGDNVGNKIDILSNGVKIRGTSGAYNGSGNDYLVLAFAEHPFAGTTPATAR